jgi:hypothetical protein
MLAALATLTTGLLGVALVMLTDPIFADQLGTTIGYAFLYAAAGLVVLTVAMLRGSRGAWLLTCSMAAFCWLAPAAWWVPELVEELRNPTEGMVPSSGRLATVPEPSLLDPIMAGAPWLVIGGAAGATVMLLLPATRRGLRRSARPAGGGPARTDERGRGGAG